MNKSLEGLRGAAALIIVLFHMQFSVHALDAAQGGYLAVDLFFVLSGFVICRAYDGRITHRSEWFAFMLRRFGRLYPANIVTTLVYFALLYFAPLYSAMPQANGHTHITSLADLVPALTMTNGLPISSEVVGLPVTWSTSNEFYVYMLFGLLCLVLRARARVAAFAALAFGGYAAAVYASLVTHACVTTGWCYDMVGDYGWARCFAGFFIGVLIAKYREHRVIVSFGSPLTQVLALTLVAVVILSGARITALAAPIVFAVLVASLSSDTGPVARLFSLRVFQWLGALSYSLYLAHDLFRPYLNIAAASARTAGERALIGIAFLLASFACAYVLHKYVESPWRARFAAWSNGHRGSRAALVPSNSVSPAENG